MQPLKIFRNVRFCFRALVNNNSYQDARTVSFINSNGDVALQNDASNTSLSTLSAETYTVRIGNSEHTQKFSLGGVYAVLATGFGPSRFVSSRSFVIKG